MRTNVEVNNEMDVIDSRDVIARIEELEDLRDSAEMDAKSQNEELDELERELAGAETEEDKEAIQEKIDDHPGRATKVFSNDGKREYYASDDFGEDEEEELHILLDLQDECEGYSDWRHGETLIRDSYFTEYAQQLADDLGYIKKDVNWPYDCIDWEKAADELKTDYTSVDFDGVEYWIRSC